MASGLITSWHEKEKVEIVTDLFSCTPKSLGFMTAAMKLRCLLFERKAITSLCSILKSTNNTLPTKVHIVKTTVFPIVMYGYANWTIE